MKPGDVSFTPDYYPTFGQTFTNPAQLKDAIKKEQYEKGIELIEVGNERPKYTPVQQKIDYDSAGRELQQTLRKIRGRTR